MKIFFVLVAMIAALVLCSCTKHGDDDDSAAPSADDTGDDTGDDSAADDDDTAADDDTADVVKHDVEFSLEYRNTLRVQWEEHDDNLEGLLWTQAGYGDDLLAAGQTLNISGRILRFPESHYLIYSMRFGGEAVPTGPCGASSLKYVLTLTGQEGASEWLGGIAAYCGEESVSRPQRYLRIVGNF